jgi:hypothetical protein
MRHIGKQAGSPAEVCIRGFIDVQMNGRASGVSWEELRVDYGSFTRTAQLRPLLIAEQKGLCAYTGVGIDERLAERRPSRLEPPRTDYWFTPHIEHLKPEEQCRNELVASGGVVGRDPGEDMAYENMVAAIEVSGTPDEHFGASYRGTKPLPIIPTNPACARAFVYLESGDIADTSDPSKTTIENLKLDHPTLISWRRGAIRGLLPLGSGTAREDLESIIQLLEDETRHTLPEFSFVLAQIARFHLAEIEAHDELAIPPIGWVDPNNES